MISEHIEFEALSRRHHRYFRLTRGLEVDTLSGREPQYVFELCDLQIPEAERARLPVLGLFAGVHGIEAIGVKILHRFIDHMLEQLEWNENIRQLLRRVRVLGIPVVNPAGYVAGTRCNGTGVDLMRNAPVESPVSLPFVGGQRLSNLLPYFRGQGLEPENVSLVRLVREALFTAPFALTLDVHSGFGMEDFLWTPWAKQRGFPPHWPEYTRFCGVLDRALKHHVYRFEPQSVNYCTSGDLWDFLYQESLGLGGKGLFMPLTLEVGSWVWLKKSPRNALRLRSFFNPMQPHRERRVLRRHLPLLSLLVNAVADYERVFLGVEPNAALDGSVERFSHEGRVIPLRTVSSKG